MVISPDYKKIAVIISSQIEQGITIFTATGFYSSKEQPMLYMITSSKKLIKIIPIIEHEDPNAFITVENVRSARGLYIRDIV